MPTAGGAWVNVRGSLWRVSAEQMRVATSEESTGVEIVNRFLSHMKTSLNKARQARKFVDVEQEGPPRFPGESPSAPGNEEDDYEIFMPSSGDEAPRNGAPAEEDDDQLE